MWKRIQLAEICKKSYFDNFACGSSALYSRSLKIEDQQLVCLLRNIYIYIYNQIDKGNCCLCILLAWKVKKKNILEVLTFLRTGFGHN